MSQIEIPKLTTHAALGPAGDEIAVTKLTVHVILVPTGSSGGDDSNRQGHVYGRVVKRAGEF